jgi:hypothetical protein
LGGSVGEADEVGGVFAGEDGEHVGGGEAALGHFGLVAGVGAVDEVLVPGVLRVEVGAEAAVGEGVRDVAEGVEEPEAEAVEEEGEDVLGADAFEAFEGAVPVGVGGFLAAELAVVSVGFGQLVPELFDEMQGFGPAAVAVATDHVGDDEEALRGECGVTGAEEGFELDDVVEGLVGEDGVVWRVGLPGVEVGVEGMDVRGEVLAGGGFATAFKHGLVEVEAVDGEVGGAGLEEGLGEADFGIAVACPEAEETAGFTGGLLVGFGEAGGEELVGGGDAELLHFGEDVAVEPVEADGREVVDFSLIVILGEFGGVAGGVVGGLHGDGFSLAGRSRAAPSTFWWVGGVLMTGAGD